MARRKRRSGPKRTLTPEQLQKMQEGKKRAQEERARQAERAEMLSELDQRLADARHPAGMVPRLRTRRRRFPG